MAYEVLLAFTDSTDNKYLYRAGDTFPRPGAEVSEDRIKELSGNHNKIGVPLIRRSLSEPLGDALGNNTGVDSVATAKAKGRPRKGQGRRARTDS